MKLVVLHGSYGCDTGCCGHYIQDEDGDSVGQFTFGHPFDRNAREFAEGMIREQCGEEHVKDLDWDHCIVVDD